MFKSRTLLIPPIIFFANICNAQESNQAISRLFESSSGNIYMYDAKKLNIDQFPPSVVSMQVAVFEGNKVTSNEIWQFNCRTEEYKIGNRGSSSIRTGMVSTSFFMNKAFCGIKDNDGYWFHLAERKLPLNPLFMNLESVKKTSKPVDGISVLTKAGGINYEPTKINFSSQNPEEMVFDCGAERYFYKQDGAYVEAILKNGDALYAARYNLCVGVYSSLHALKKSGSTVSSAQTIDAAKLKCTDLGFKSGTEDFGKMRTSAFKIIFIYFLLALTTSAAQAAPSRYDCLVKLGNNSTKEDIDACVKGVPVTNTSSSQVSSIDTSSEEAICLDLGFKKKSPAFANCVLELLERKENSTASTDPDDATCRKYGFKRKTNEYAACRQQIEQARLQAAQQQAQYLQQQKQYQAQLDEQKRQKSQAAGLALMQLGTGISSGAYNANNAYGALPTPPNPNRTYILPGGKMMNCTTTGTVTNCF